MIPTHDRTELLRECLRSLAAADFPPDRFEVIVADAASGDGTRACVEQLATRESGPPIRYLAVPSTNANAARNAGIRIARGELVALVDDDVVVPAGWLRALDQGTTRWPSAACFGGAVRPMFEAAPPRTCAAHELAGAQFDEGPDPIPVAEVWGCNMALRREALARIGELDERLIVQQEWEWQQRLLAGGGQIVYLPDAWLWHRRLASELRLTATLREFFLRGYIKARLGQRVAIGHAMREARRLLAHGIRARCRRGLTEAARELGLAVGALRTPRAAARPPQRV